LEETKMKLNFSLLALVLISFSLLIFADAKPNLTGVWKMDADLGKETMKIDHKEPTLHIVHYVDDPNGKRTIDFTVKTDGKEYKHQIQGLPSVFIAKWEGDVLMLESKRERSFGSVHIRRWMTFSKDGKTITHKRTNYNPDGTVQFTRTEIWQKQE